MVTSYIPTMCLNCSTVCGMIAKVEDGKIKKLSGNPNDPNAKGKLCAKGQAAINMAYDPDRITHPMRRIGPRGGGEWQRISWEEALSEIGDRLRKLRQEKRPEEMVLLYGRDRTNGFLERFTDAFGTPNKLGHRGLCSLNKRMAIRAVIGETDWDTPDFAHAHYILNFGSNLYEAHQGHVGMMSRVAEAKRKGATLVTFDVRLSNTAAQSTEWIPVFPGTDGLIALAIGHVLLRDDLQDTAFIEDWTNASLAEWKAHYEPYTPEVAEKASGVPAEKIEELAYHFAKAAPRATTITNRGAHAHENGFYNEWAILCLNAIVGSIGKKGGWCYIKGDVNLSAPQPGPIPPKPKIQTVLSHPPEFPFVNEVYPRAVSSTIFPFIAEGKAKVDTLLSYYVNAPMSWPGGPTFVRDVLLDESLIPFHVVIDAFYSEMVETADIVLPDATFLEKWDLDARNSYELRPYVGLRQPVIQPLGECQDIRDTLIKLAGKIDADMQHYFNFANAEDFIRIWADAVPGGLTQLQKTGIWTDETREPAYEPYLQALADDQYEVDEQGLVRMPATKQVVGRSVNGRFVTGFATPDRRFQFKLPQLAPHAIKPIFRSSSIHTHLAADEYILTTFKWNVHTQSRTANQKWLTEIVGDNPCWIHPVTAELHHIQQGQEMLIQVHDQTEPLAVTARVTEAIHPQVLAISASFGHWQYGRTAKNKGVNPNALISSKTDPIGGGQAWNDTIVTIKKGASQDSITARNLEPC